MAEIFSRTMANNLSALEKLLSEASTWLEERNLTSQAVQMVLEEIITNTIKYGYADAAEHQIEIRIEVVPSFLEITITDDGGEFNPLLTPETDTAKPIEEREIGGLGIHLVRKLATAMNYKRLDGKNILKVRVTIPRNQTPR